MKTVARLHALTIGLWTGTALFMAFNGFQWRTHWLTLLVMSANVVIMCKIIIDREREAL